MAQPSARRAALTALRLWRRAPSRSDSVLSKILADVSLGASDRAFALELFYGVLRNLTLLDFWVGRLRQSKVDVDLRDILRLGLYQLFLANVSEHAAVYESVALAPQSRRGFINGMLRNAIRERGKLQSDAEAQPLAIQSSHPEFLIARWREQFGDKEVAALCAWNNQPPRLYARINQLKIGREEFMRSYPAASAVPGLTNFVEFASRFPNDALNRGHCYIQDPSTRIACELLDPQPGETILDACAAPGGKTTYLAELMQNRGAIVACDRQSERIEVLEENIESLAIEVTRVVRHDWTRGDVPAPIATTAPFDRILIDAPCTNTGVMRRRVDVRWRLRPEEFARMKQLQLSIIRPLVSLLKPNGVLVYSTCSMEMEENRSVAHQLLNEMRILRLDAERDCFPFREGFDGAYAAKLISIQ